MPLVLVERPRPPPMSRPPFLREENVSRRHALPSDPDCRAAASSAPIGRVQSESGQSTLPKERERQTNIVLPPISSLHSSIPSPQTTSRHRPGSIASITSSLDAPPIQSPRTSLKCTVSQHRWEPYSSTSRPAPIPEDVRRRSDSPWSQRSSSQEGSNTTLTKSVTAPMLPSMGRSTFDAHQGRRASSTNTGYPPILRAHSSQTVRPLDPIEPPKTQPRRTSTAQSRRYNRHTSIGSTASSLSGYVSPSTTQVPSPTYDAGPPRPTEAPTLPAPYQPPRPTTTPLPSLLTNPNLPPASNIPAYSPIPIDTLQASHSADEKRKRNAGASARFRARRRERENTSAQVIDDLRRQLDDAGRDAEFWRKERDALVVALEAERRERMGGGAGDADADAGVERGGDGD